MGRSSIHRSHPNGIKARLSRPVSRGVAMGNIRGARDGWNGAVRPGRDFRGHRLVGHRSRYSRIAHSYISRSDDVVSMRTMKHAWSGPRFFALAQRNGTTPTRSNNRKSVRGSRNGSHGARGLNNASLPLQTASQA